MKLIIASNNAHKVREIKEILGAYFPVIHSMEEAGISLDVVEDGTTFEENAIKKAEETLKAASSYDAALADDSGLMVDALSGDPGVYSARYAGDGHDDAANNEKLKHNMKGAENRACKFVSAVALARKADATLCATGECLGILLEEERGGGGFGYDPLFYYEPVGATFAEMPQEEKNAVSHRKRALEALKNMMEGK